MNYLERNELVIGEIRRDLRLKKRDNIADTGRTSFTPLGDYYSQIVGQRLFVGLKRYYSFRSSYSEGRVINDLAFIRAIEQKAPHLMPELPSFYGLLVAGNGRHLGVITEDFSRAGKHEVHDMDEGDSNLPTELRKVVNDPRLHDEELAKVCFVVDGQRRLGDFNTIRAGLNVRESIERFPLDDIMNDIEKYTLRMTYPFR